MKRKRSYGAPMWPRKRRKFSGRMQVPVPVTLQAVPPRQRMDISGRSRSMNLRTGGYLGTEFKYFDTQHAKDVLPAAWAGGEVDPAVYNCLCAPVKGTGPSDRDGDKICITGIHLRGVVQMDQDSDANDTIQAQTYCIMIVLDRQTNGTQLSAEDVMVDTAPRTQSFRNIQYSSRFKVLKRWFGTLHQTAVLADGANTGSTTGNGRVLNCNLKCKIPVTFSGNAGTIADITDNSIHIIACASNATTVNFEYYARVRFVG